MSVGRERRVTEQLINDWQEETRRLGHALAFMTLDNSAMTGPKWAHRFIIAVDPVVEHSSFLFYGAGFATLLGLPPEPDKSVPIRAQLPARYVRVFTNGCIASSLSSAPIRMQGAVDCENGRQPHACRGPPFDERHRSADKRGVPVHQSAYPDFTRSALAPDSPLSGESRAVRLSRPARPLRA